MEENMSVLVFNNDNFENEVLKSDKSVLLDFYADWCGPCKMQSPIVDEIAQEQDGVVKVGKINVDNSPELAEKYGIMSIPTLIIIKNGEVAKQFVGITSKDVLLENLK